MLCMPDFQIGKKVGSFLKHSRLKVFKKSWYFYYTDKLPYKDFLTDCQGSILSFWDFEKTLECFHLHKILSLHHIFTCPFKASYTHILGKEWSSLVSDVKHISILLVIPSLHSFCFLKNLHLDGLLQCFLRLYSCKERKALAFWLRPLFLYYYLIYQVNILFLCDTFH